MVVVILWTLGSSALFAQDPGRLKEPAIREIRVLYQAVEDSAVAGRYRRADTTWTCDGGAVKLDIEALRDSAGLMRRLKVSGGAGDSYQIITYYYDGTGHLRFAFTTRSAVNGTKHEVRAYWERGGTLLHRDTRGISGPGWAWGDAEEVWEPEAWVGAGCG